MTTRQELREMVDLVADENLHAAAQALRPFAHREPLAPGPKSLGAGQSGRASASERAERPAFIGMARSGRGDLSERTDDVLRETGFGE